MIHGFASEVLITLVIKIHIISAIARRTNEETTLMSKKPSKPKSNDTPLSLLSTKCQTFTLSVCQVGAQRERLLW